MAECKVTNMDEFIIQAKRIMNKRNMSQSDLAKATNISKSTIGKVLCGISRMPQKHTIKPIADELDIDISGIEAYNLTIPIGTFNPANYFKKEEFDEYINECIQKVNKAYEDLNELMSFLNVIKQRTKINEELAKEHQEQDKQE